MGMRVLTPIYSAANLPVCLWCSSPGVEVKHMPEACPKRSPKVQFELIAPPESLVDFDRLITERLAKLMGVPSEYFKPSPGEWWSGDRPNE